VEATEVKTRIVGVLVAAMALAIAGAAAQTPGDFFKSRSGCKMWWTHGKDPQYNSTVSVDWHGSCRNGLAQGHATFEVVEKFQYDAKDAPMLTPWTGEGDAVDGKLSGRAFYVASGGKRRVEGEFRDGVLNGKGFFFSELDGLKDRTEGEFRGGRLNGWGVRERDVDIGGAKPIHIREEGEFRDGKLNGRGVEVKHLVGCTVQSRYEGAFKDGLYDGPGTLTAYSGKVYTGVWQGAALNGKSAMFDLNRGEERCH
jgi:hypothetical protein